MGERGASCERRRARRRRRAGLALLVVVGAVASACSTAGGARDGVGEVAAAPATAPTVGAAATTGAVAAPGGDATASLRVTQQQLGCCYPTGHLSWLVVRDRAGDEVLARRFRTLSAVTPVIDERVRPGRYHLVSAQQPCESRSCVAVVDPVDRCDRDVVVADGAQVFVTVTLVPARGCTIALAPAPVPSPTGDEIALSTGALDCGHDGSLAEAAATGGEVVPSAARRCFVGSVLGGTPAWLSAQEPELVVYRSRADGSVVVYRVRDEQAPVWVWVRNTCVDLVPDSVRGFLLQGCAPAEAVPWAPTGTADRPGQ